MAGIAFAELWKSFMANLKVRASKMKALAKVKALEREDAKEDAKASGQSARKMKRREVDWKMESEVW